MTALGYGIKKKRVKGEACFLFVLLDNETGQSEMPVCELLCEFRFAVSVEGSNQWVGSNLVAYCK